MIVQYFKLRRASSCSGISPSIFALRQLRWLFQSSNPKPHQSTRFPFPMSLRLQSCPLTLTLLQNDIDAHGQFQSSNPRPRHQSTLLPFLCITILCWRWDLIVILTLAISQQRGWSKFKPQTASIYAVSFRVLCILILRWRWNARKQFKTLLQIHSDGESSSPHPRLRRGSAAFPLILMSLGALRELHDLRLIRVGLPRSTSTNQAGSLQFTIPSAGPFVLHNTRCRRPVSKSGLHPSFNTDFLLSFLASGSCCGWNTSRIIPSRPSVAIYTHVHAHWHLPKPTRDADVKTPHFSHFSLTLLPFSSKYNPRIFLPRNWQAISSATTSGEFTLKGSPGGRNIRQGNRKVRHLSRCFNAIEISLSATCSYVLTWKGEEAIRRRKLKRVLG